MKVPNLNFLRKKYNRESKEIDRKLIKLPLKGAGEDFVYLPDLAKKSKAKIVFDKDEEYSAFLRKSVAESLIKAASDFNKKGFTLKVESAYRSLESQKRRFLKRVDAMKKRYPQKPKKELLELANVYTAGIPILAGHTAGAAVDVTLLDKIRKPLNFGVPYRYGDVESATVYPYLPKQVIQNRRILLSGMEEFGFTNYPYEYWHFSIGDVYAAYFKGEKSAKFGPVEYDFKKKTLQVPRKGEIYKFFK